MSSAVISTSAAQGRFFIFDAECAPEVCPLPSEKLAEAPRSSPAARFPQSTIKNQQSRILTITPASHLSIRPAPEMVSSGIAAIDSLAGGFPRGCLTEIFGSASSGRTTILLAALAAATRRGEFCAIVDAGDTLDPQSAAAAAIELDRLLWVRCGETSPLRSNPPQRHRVTEKQNFGRHPERNRFSGGAKDLPRMATSPREELYGGESRRPSEHSLEQLLRVTDLLLESGGFGLIALDLCDLPPQTARRIPLTTWFRFRRAVEHTPTILLVIERQSIAGSCSSLLIKLAAANQSHSHADARRKNPTHARLFTGLEITAEIVRSRMERKPAASVASTFASKPAWAG
jgi:recombination protein RecA